MFAFAMGAPYADNLLADLLGTIKERRPRLSDEALADELGIGQSLPSMWRKGKRLPTDLNMLKICELAEFPPHLGLMWLGSRRNRDNPAGETYRHMYELCNDLSLTE